MPGTVALEYVTRVCKVLDENHLPSIRYYMEIFMARCLVSDPCSFLPEYVLSRYNSFNIRTPTLVSLLFSTAYILPHIIRQASDSSGTGAYQNLLKLIMTALYPWMGAAWPAMFLCFRHAVKVKVNSKNANKLQCLDQGCYENVN